MSIQNTEFAKNTTKKSLIMISSLAFSFVVSGRPSFALWSTHSPVYALSPLVETDIVVNDKDKVAIRKAISGQIQAFRSGDKERAFSYASPGVKQQFDTPAEFFAAVKSAYDVVLVPRSVVFEDLKQVMGVVTQPVLFLAADGDTVIGSYIMERQNGGDWKISGCYLAPIK